MIKCDWCQTEFEPSVIGLAFAARNMPRRGIATNASAQKCRRRNC